MKVDVEELGACKRRLQVEETPEVVQEAWARAVHPRAERSQATRLPQGQGPAQHGQAALLE
jgi:hypothetical protein